MINEFYKDMTGKGSVIRQFFDYANKKGAEIGMENIYNFSIGNPSVPVPQTFTNRMIELLQTEDPVKLCTLFPGICSLCDRNRCKAYRDSCRHHHIPDQF